MLVELKKLKGKAGSTPTAKVVVRERVTKEKKIDPKARAEAERKAAMAEATAIEQRTLRNARRGARR